ncbi:PH domain-containing protein [Nocardioides sp.]|uniref:PH domain-containing protein n=1 Tax=Nocardioides sp. TaxID=35761 RepID=UPI00286B35C6|nr:PH domain-containing protein [Nocardioides sp.]
MPAASEPGTVPLPRTWRPLGPRIAGIVAFGALVVVVLFLWIGFDDETRRSVTPFQRGTVLALGLLGFVTIYALVRSRAVAQTDGLVVVNGYRRHQYAWAEVVAVRMPPGAPWVTLDLADGTTAPVLAIQGSDGQRARIAVRELRALVDGAHPPRDR